MTFQSPLQLVWGGSGPAALTLPQGVTLEDWAGQPGLSASSEAPVPRHRAASQAATGRQ